MTIAAPTCPAFSASCAASSKSRGSPVAAIGRAQFQLRRSVESDRAQCIGAHLAVRGGCRNGIAERQCGQARAESSRECPHRLPDRDRARAGVSPQWSQNNSAGNAPAILRSRCAPARSSRLLQTNGRANTARRAKIANRENGADVRQGPRDALGWRFKTAAHVTRHCAGSASAAEGKLSERRL